MLSPRIRRLKLDYESLQQRLAGWPVIRMVGTAGMPPELYRFQYLLRGLYVAPDGAILERDEHVLEVNLSLGYPRRAPQCRMLTPVFHPNFDDASVCIGDFWAASESLDDLIIRIGRMIAYQEYNTKSPLNGLAAKWAAQNPQLLPVDAQPIAPPLINMAPQEASQTAAPPSPPPESSAEEPAPSAPSAADTGLPSGAPESSATSSNVARPGPAGGEDIDPWEQKIVIS
ncbi:MAG: ubiquitin-conjugating enzyme E2 [Terriglobales bacterium]